MPKIAIIQYDDAIRYMYEHKFKQSRFFVKTAGDGKTGLQLLKNFWPDVVLMDMNLPFLSGVEAIKRIQKSPSIEKPKILLTSNLDEDMAKKRLGHIGIDDYILKAEHTPAQILDIVQRMIGINK